MGAYARHPDKKHRDAMPALMRRVNRQAGVGTYAIRPYGALFARKH
jgi:hypothetical protein